MDACIDPVFNQLETIGHQKIVNGRQWSIVCLPFKRQSFLSLTAHPQQFWLLFAYLMLVKFCNFCVQTIFYC